MKKFLKLPLLLLVLSAGSFLCTPSAYGQKGEKTLGIAGGYASYNNAGMANLFFQYSFSNHVRLAPELGYIFPNDGKSAFDCSLDVQFPFRVARGVKLYPFTGITLNSWNFGRGEHSTKGGFDFGGGLELYMTSSLKLNIQGKYSLMNDTSGGFVQMGIGYVF